MDKPIDPKEAQEWIVKWGSAMPVSVAIRTSAPPPYRIGDLIQKAMDGWKYERIDP